MKPGHISGQSCSCTSCLYRSESERPSFLRFIADTSKVDQLYLGKYIPLRERKLLSKLVKTRAAYDDVRKELLSSSNATVSENVKLREQRTAKEDDETEKSSTQAILELVELVDRGEAGTAKLSECCSCCVCNPDGVHVHSHGGYEHHRYGHQRHMNSHHKRGHAMDGGSIIEKHNIREGIRSKRPTRFKAKHIRSVPCTCTFGLSDAIKRQSKAFVKKVKKRPKKAEAVMEPTYKSLQKESHEVHGVQKVKNFARRSYENLKESETLKRSMETLKRTNKVLDDKIDDIRHSQIDDLRKSINQTRSLKTAPTTDNTDKSALGGGGISFRKVKQSNIICDCKENIEARVKRSIERLKSTKQKIEDKVEDIRQSQIEDLRKSLNQTRYLNFEAGVKKSLETLKSTKTKIQDQVDHIRNSQIANLRKYINQTTSARPAVDNDTYENIPEKPFAIKKDSFIKFKDKLRRSHDINEWACEHECYPKECVPEDCLKILLKNRARRAMLREARERTTRKSGKRVSKSTTESSIDVHAQNDITNARVGTIKTGATQSSKTIHVPKPQGSISLKARNKRKHQNKNLTTTVGKRDKKIKSKASGAGRENKSRSVKSMMDVTSAADSIKTTTKKNKDKVPLTRTVEHQDVRVESTPRRTVFARSVNRQAVRISSSFSFNVEFYKDRPVNLLESEQNFEPKARHITEKRPKYDVKKIHKGHHVRKIAQRHKESESASVNIIKPTHSRGHHLKRCFCTLKLKRKKTKVKVSKSAAKGTSTPKHLSGFSTESVLNETSTPDYGKKLLPYECEPGVCTPDECDPVECEKRIQQRNKLRSAKTNTRYRSKSVYSITQSIPSRASSKRSQAYSPRSAIPIQSPPQVIKARPADRRPNMQKQAVCVGSSFSFNIEFFKETPTSRSPERAITTYSKDYSSRVNSLQKPKPRKYNRDRGIDRKVHHVYHKPSQRSTSTGISKYTSTNHSLRRCFCTLQLKPLKGMVKKQSIPKSSLTSRSTITQTPKLKQKKKGNIRNHRKLLPGECEPGICVSNECNPYECLKFIKMRERGTPHEKLSGTKNRRTKSAASWTSRSLTPSKGKKVQSTIVTYKTEVPPQKYKDNVFFNKIPREIRTSPSSPNRQAVRIGSTFSFDIEFFKDRISPVNYAPVKPPAPKKPEVVDSKKNNLRELGARGDALSVQKPLPKQIQKKNRNVIIGSAMKRCLCTLNLFKKGNLTKKQKGKVDIGTETLKFKEETYPKMVVQSTKIKRKLKLNQAPHECEPYVCIPGECDPYECLKRIKGRAHSKEISTLTDRIKMRSGSSLTQYSSTASRTSRTKVRQQKKPKTKKNARNNIHPYYVKKSVDSFSDRVSRQAVKIGSGFGFDIEFYKNRQVPFAENQIIVQPTKRKTDIYSRNKNTRAKTIEITTNHQGSQVVEGTKKHRAMGLKPILNRCFCTLELRKKDKKQIKNLMKSAVKPPNVYTISRVAVAETKITTQAKLYGNELHTRYPITYAQYKRQKLLKAAHFNTSKHNVPQPHFSSTSNEKNPKTVRSYLQVTTLNKPQSYESFTNSYYVIRSNDSSKLCFPKNLNINKQYSPTHVTHENSFLRRRYCTMNIITDVRRHKLKPYECEPGVCVPYDCNPVECQKRIMRRLKTKMSSKSTSSYSNTPSQKARKHQSNIPLRSAKTTHVRGPVGGISYKSIPRRPKKQMVRVGSTFSFDIEFSKNRSTVQKQQKLKESKLQYHSDTRPIKSNNGKTKGTKGKKINSYDRDTQSGTSVLNKGSSISPILKRCFCTLKLHKTGENIKRQKREKKQKRIIQTTSQSTMTTLKPRPNVIKAPAMTADHNVKSYKLQPFECEPNVCIPEQCNPYECLELIKQRDKKYKTREFGTTSPGSRATSSGTDSKAIRSKYIQPDYGKRKGRAKIDKSKDANPKHSQFHKYSPPNKQVVRIGSSFSFNIEFYKDKSPQIDRYRAAAKAVKMRQKKEKQKHTKGTGFTGISQDQSRESQAGIKTGHKSSGVAPILKRCFCTMTFQKQNQQVLKKQINMATQGTKTHSIKEIPTLHTRSVMTKQKISKLKPYECEPYTCVPGKCDPYECQKRIEKRLHRGTLTKHRGTKSVASDSSTTSKTKTVQYDSNRKYPDKKHKISRPPVQFNDKVRYTKPGTQKISRNILSGRPGRQAVRIGSSFNFNIEFHKDRGDSNRTLKFQNEGIKYGTNVPQLRIKSKTGTSQDRRSIHSTKSQIGNKKNIRSTATGINPFLQRCFCTLSLKKPEQRQEIKAKKAKFKEAIALRDTTNPVVTETIFFINQSLTHTPFRAVMNRTNQAYRLETYECEPFVCVPGQCNPKECMERINRRHLKELGTSTKRPRTKSIGSTGIKVSRTNKTQHKHINTGQINDKYKVPRKSIASPHKEVVRFGSNFDFDVEFFKESYFGDNKMKHEMVPAYHEQIIIDNTQNSKKQSPEIKRNIIDHKKNVPHRDSKHSIPQNTKKTVNTFLNRCFCTLKLQKSKKKNAKTPGIKLAVTKPAVVKPDSKELKVILPPKPTVGTTDRATKTKNRKTLRKLEPYECEPGICIPGECNPYECMKTIKLRRMKSRKAGTDGHRERSISTSSSTRVPEYKHQKYGNHKAYIVEEPRFKNIDIPFKRVVRISSNFSFNIEFCKDGSPDMNKGDHKTSSKYNGSINKKSKGACTRGMCVRNRHVQSNETETRGVDGVRPLLQRCFCTLKLMGKQQQIPKPNIKPDNKKNYEPNDKTKNIGVGTKIKLYKHECEPYICVPGQCNPYECLERIKKRTMKDLGVGPAHAMTKSATTLTFQDVKCRETQCYKDPGRKCKNTQCAMKSNHDKTYVPNNRNHPHYSSISNNNQDNKSICMSDNKKRQSVHISSNFSFDVELFKDRTPALMNKLSTNVLNHNHKTDIKHLARHRNGVNKGSYRKDQLRNHKSQVSRIKTESRGSGIDPKLKRCFCTLKLKQQLHNNIYNGTKTVNYVSLQVNSPLLPYNTTIVREKHDKTNDPPLPVVSKDNKSDIHYLSPCECQVCVPGQCNPCGCLQRTNTGRRSCRTTLIHANEQKETSCMTAEWPQISQLKNKRSPKVKKMLNVDKFTPSLKVPNFSNMVYNRQIVQYCSNMGCNIDGFKRTISRQKITCSITGHCDNDIKRYSPKSIKGNIKTKSKNKNIQSIQPLSNGVQTKTMGITNRLKRWLCTLKSESKTVAPSHNVMVKRVAVEEKKYMSPLYRKKLEETKLSRRRHLKGNSYHKRHKVSQCQTCDENQIEQNPCFKKIETVLPYNPNKFNKNNYVKAMHYKINKKIAGHENQYQEPPNKKEPIISNSFKFSLKNFIGHCRKIFTKSPKDIIELKHRDNITTPRIEHNTSTKCNDNNRHQNMKVSNADLLKSSKSDRHQPTYANIISEPKKSKSLKISKRSDCENCNADVHNKPGRTKYSQFQSGDTQPNYMKPMYINDSNFSPIQANYNTEYMCAYCQVLYNKDTKNNRYLSPYMDNKVVQMLIAPNKKKVKRRTDKKVAIKSQGAEVLNNTTKKAQQNEIKQHLDKPNHVNKKPKNTQKNIKQVSDITNPDDQCCPCLKNKKVMTKPLKPKDNPKLQESTKESKKLTKESKKSKISKKSKKLKTIDKSKTAKHLKPPRDHIKPILTTGQKDAAGQKPNPPPYSVCKTKKPCVCCGGASQKSVIKDNQCIKKRVRIEKKEKCKDHCALQSEEDAKSTFVKLVEKFEKYLIKKPVAEKCDKTPMFKMKLASGSMAVLNRDEIYDKIMKLRAMKKEANADMLPRDLKLLHGEFCRCCICQSIRRHGQQQGLHLPRGIKHMSLASVLGIGKKPCICGSQICASESVKLADEKAEKKKQMKKRKPCVCGTKICESEALKVAMKQHLVSKKGGQEMKKALKQKEKDKMMLAQQEVKDRKAREQYALRQKKYKLEDELRKKKQRKEEKKMDKQVLKYKNTSGWLLAAESLLDLGQLVIKTATGILRSTGRAVIDPKRTIKAFVDAKNDPGRIFSNVKAVWSDSGVVSTSRRMRKRCGAMSCVTGAKETLERFAITNYLLHMCDKNPKARLLRKKRLIRKREPVDFQCSLFMASLRRRPWFGIYQKCPWFYPHCISMIHILRSFIDVLLFLLAVVVWSPCLLCMEICRACMCCTLCTG